MRITLIQGRPDRALSVSTGDFYPSGSVFPMAASDRDDAVFGVQNHFAWDFFVGVGVVAAGVIAGSVARVRRSRFLPDEASQGLAH